MEEEEQVEEESSFTKAGSLGAPLPCLVDPLTLTVTRCCRVVGQWRVVSRDLPRILVAACLSGEGGGGFGLRQPSRAGCLAI